MYDLLNHRLLQVFAAVGGPALDNGRGQQSWDACINNVTAGLGSANKTTLDILERVRSRLK